MKITCQCAVIPAIYLVAGVGSARIMWGNYIEYYAHID